MKRYLSDNKQPETLSTQPLIYERKSPNKYTALDWVLVALYVAGVAALGYSIGLAV